MKKYRIAILALLLLFLLGSCSVEKRHYRSGWYLDRVNKAEDMIESQINRPVFRNEKTVPVTATDSVSTATSETGETYQTTGNTTVADSAAAHSSATKVQSKSEPLPKMSYSEATKRMKEKGCKPNSLAHTVYWLGLASVLMCWFGLGFLTALIGFILSFFAESQVRASGECVDENLALVRSGRITNLVVLLCIALLTLLIIGFIFAVIQFGFMGLTF